MAIRTFQDYVVNQAWDNRWFIYDTTVVTDLLEWAVLVQVNVAGNFNVKGESKPCGYLALVGKPSAIPGSVFTETHVLVDAQYHSEEYGKAPFSDQTASSYVDRSGYRYWGTPYGSIVYGAYEPDYTFNSAAAFNAALDNGDISPYNTKLKCDVYINGSSEPSIWAKFTSEFLNRDQIVEAEVRGLMHESTPVWASSDTSFIYQDTETVDELVVVKESDWTVNNEGVFGLGSQYAGQWLTIANAIKNHVSAAQAATAYNNVDGMPPEISLLLQFGYEDTASYIYRVVIPRTGIDSLSDITVEPIPGSKTTGEAEPKFLTEVVIHLTHPDDTILPDELKYPEGKDANGDDGGVYGGDGLDPDDYTDAEPTGFDGVNVLTRTYAMPQATLENVGTKLWSQSYFDVLKVQSNPIQNIISVKWFPFASSGTSEEIKVGDVAFGINADKISSVKVIDLPGTVTYTGRYNSFLDFAPYTVCKIWLPYCGIVQVDPARIWKCALKVKYIIDLITGDCMAKITADGVPLLNVKGRVGVDIPLTATDRVQTELKSISNTINTAAAVTGKMIGGDVLGASVSAASGALTIAGSDYNSQRVGSVASVCGTFENRMCMLIVEHPVTAEEEGYSAGYKHTHGFPCHKYLPLNAVENGVQVFKDGSFVQIDRRTDIQIGMTSEENDMLEQLLTSGVYI